MKKRKEKTINQNRSKHSKAGLIAFIENNFKYILAAIAVIIAIIAVFFGESKLIYQQEPVTANVKFSVINYEITPEVEQGQTPVVEYAYTLAQAVNKAPAGKSTIKVLVGVEETAGVTIPANKEIELDLNGKTTTFNIDAQSADTSAITNEGTLTITDNTQATEATDEYSYTFKDGTKLEIGGTLKSNKVAVTNNGTATIEGTANIHGTGNDTYTIVNDGTMTVESGTIRSTNYRTIVNGESNTASATITINDGTIISASQGLRNFGNLNQVTGQTVNAQAVKITGGKIETQVNAIVNMDTSTGLIYITGGDIRGGLKNNTATPTVYNGGNGKIIIDVVNSANTMITDYSTNAAIFNGGVNGATGTVEIRKGTIVSKGGKGVNNSRSGTTLIIGTDEVAAGETTSVSTTVPSITGATYGVYRGDGTFKFYDGIIKGVPGAPGLSIAGGVQNKPADYTVKYGTEIIDGTTYETATLQKSIPDTIINTESMYVPGAQVRLDGVHNWIGNDKEGKNYEATTWADISGSGNNGAITSNTLKWGENYLEFDGSSTWVDLGTQMNYQTITMETTISPDTFGQSRYILNNFEGAGYALYLTSGGKVGLAIKFNEDSNTKYYASDTTLEVGKIYHIVVTLDGSKIKIFINGQLDKSIDYNYTIKNSTVNMVLGANSDTSMSTLTGPYDGKIFSAAVYNRALTADEAVQNATASLALAGGTVSTPNLTYTVRFPDAVTGFTADDITLTNGTKGTFTEVTAGKVYTLDAALATNSTTNTAITQRITVAQAAATITSSGNPTSEASRTVAIAPAYQNTASNKCYYTLKEAFDEVQTNQTIKAINSTIDHSTATPTITAGKTVTFDSNGKTVVLDKKISNNGILNVESSTGNGIIYSTASECIDNLNANSQVIVNSGKIEATGTAILNTSSTKNTTASPAITITGGEISSTGSYAIASSLSSSMIYIKEVTGQTPPVIWSTGAAAIRAVGSFTMECGTVYGYSGSAVCVYRTSLITGGELIKAKNPVTNAWVGDACFDNRGNYNATIKGNAVIKNENGNSSNVVYNYGSGTLEISENAQVRNLGAVRTGTNAGKGKILVKDNAIVSSAGEDIFSNAYASSTSDNYGTIEVQGGTLSTTGNTVIRSSSNYGRIIVSGGTLSATGSSGSYGTIHNSADYAKIDIRGGTITHPNIPIYNAGGADNSEIKITGGTVETTTSTNSIYNNGTGTTIIIGTTNAASNDSPVIKGRIWGYNSDCGLITVNSGTITAKTGEAIYSLGNITVNGGIITGKNQAIIGADASGPTITVTGGKLTNELHNTGAITNSAGTTIISGTAEIEGGTKGVYATTGDIIVTGGKIVSTLGEGVYVQTGNITIGDKDDATVANNNSPVIVGKLHGVKKSDSTSGDLKFYEGIVYGPDVTHAIWGDVTDRPSGYDIVNGSAKYNGTEYKFATLAPTTANYLLHDGTNVLGTYDSLNNALQPIPTTNPTKSYRIVVLNDNNKFSATCSKGTTNYPVTLDLNGKTITISGLTNNGVLEITDTTETNNATAGKITSSSRAITNNGTLKITGKAEINNTATGSSCIVNDGTVILDGGTISSTNHKGIYNGDTNVADAKVTIISGTVTAKNYAIDNNGTTTEAVTIGTNDGIVSISEPVITSATAGICLTAGTLNFYDGIITGPTNLSIIGSGTVTTPTGYTVRKSTADNIETATLDNHYNVRYLSGNLLYGLDDCGETAGIESSSVPNKSHMNYSISNGVVTVTAKSDDGYGMTTGRLYLEANKTYRFSCSTNGTWGVNGADTVEACLMKDGLNSKYYRMESTDGYEFTPDTSGTYWLRLDVNKNGKTYTFSDISVYEIVDTQSKTYGSTYGPMPTVSRTGYTLDGWTTDSNLISSNINIWERGAIADATGLNADVSTTRLRLKDYQRISPNSTYTLTTTGDVKIRYVHLYDGSKNFISHDSGNVGNAAGRNTVTFTTPSNCQYIRVVLQNTDYTQEITLSELATANLTLTGAIDGNMLVPDNDVAVYANWTPNTYKLIKVDATDNLLLYGDFENVKVSSAPSKTANGVTHTWDKSLNGIPGDTEHAYEAASWGRGANMGVDVPEIGYHAHIRDISGNKVFRFKTNEAYKGQTQANVSGGVSVTPGTITTNRWLGILQTVSASKFTAGKQYTITMDVYRVSGTSYITSGLYYATGTSTTKSFVNGKGTFNPSSTGTWQTISWTFTLDSNYNANVDPVLYVYGYEAGSSKPGELYVDNVRLQEVTPTTKTYNAAYTSTELASVSRTGYTYVGWYNNGQYATALSTSSKFNTSTAVFKNAATANSYAYIYAKLTPTTAGVQSLSLPSNSPLMLSSQPLRTLQSDASLSNINSSDTINTVQINGTTYSTISEAIQTANSGDTIKILEDLNLTEEVIIENDKNIILNLNGKTITSSSRNTINNQGTISIIGTGIIKNEAENGVVIYNTGDLNIENVKVIVSEDDSIGIYNARDSKACVVKNTDIIIEAEEIDNYELIKNTDQFKEELELMKPSYGIYNDSEIDVVLESGTIRVERLKGVGILNNFEGAITLGVDESKDGKEIELNTGSPIIYATADNTTALINSKEGTINFYDGRILSTSTIKNIITNSLKGYEINEEFNSNSISATLKLLKAED